MSIAKRSKKPLVLFASCLFILCVILYISYVSIQLNTYKNTIAPNIYINEIPVGGLTYDEASEKIINTSIATFLNQPITLTSPIGTPPLTLNYEILGVEYSLAEALDKAFAHSHEGKPLTQYNRYKKGTKEPIHLNLTPSIDEVRLKSALAEHAKHFEQAPVDATMKRVNHGFVFSPEAVGYQLDVDALLPNLTASLLTNEPFEISVPLVEVAPTLTVSYLKELQTPLASFSTSYNNADKMRNENIRLASEKINKMLLPDEKFMFSQQLEPITTDAGYKSAKVISNGDFTEGIGGGICQVSSTLYNAVIQTDLKIYMRRNHSLPVSYTPLGLDATYATNSVDFQFINNSGHPLYIESYTANNKVYVTLYGHKDFKPDYQSQFETILEEEIAPGSPRYEDDPTLPLGTEVQKSAAKPGKKVTVYKHYYKDGQLIKTKKLNTSTYKAQTALIKRGTMLPTPSASPTEVTP